MIERNEFSDHIDVSFCIVGEQGSSKYSISDIARKEFGPDAEVKQISAISIGRRLLDPKSKLIKYNPVTLGKGEYQYSQNEKRLEDELHKAIKDNVSLIGVDLNVVSKRLLKSISGIDEKLAEEIVAYREKNGPFESRKDLRKVPGMTRQTFQMCAGFLTVSRPDGSNSTWSPFDETSIHPDDYELATRVLTEYDVTVEEIRQGTKVPFPKTEEARSIIWMIADRPKLRPPPPLMKKAPAFSKLTVGDIKTGLVMSQTDFGLFVNIGCCVGLVHISQFRQDDPHFRGNREVPEDYPKVHDFLDVEVTLIDDCRISLKLAPKKS